MIDNMASSNNKKRILFIDRDGTLIIEPEDEQIDSFEKLKFYPGALQYLPRIAKELDYELVLVTNQDGLGTDSHPEANFWPVHRFIMETFAGEGVHFSKEHIDRTFPHEQAETRKPGIGMLKEYFDTEKYDLANSYVIGDRINDVRLAQNLGAKAIWLRNNDALGANENLLVDAGVIALETTEFKKVYEFLKVGNRAAVHQRTTNETDIYVSVNLDGKGQAAIETGLPFFDHMLDQLARHGSMDLTIKTKGDLHIDEHHTIEDTALALGETILKALGDKRGIERYGFCLPMDDCLAQVALDFGGRNWLVWEAEFKREKIGEMPTEMFIHFFKSFSDAAKCNLNIKAEGQNEHHKIEAIFKAFAKAIKMAVKRDPDRMELPSTKGVL
ncbi:MULTISPECIES: bifunctional histidinol-phosphatase/imidazoleglycerol-phosphate dehydratase HisB [Olivibacter]|uniref:Histidine biosynthesis bifunctional protein HisB n=2 Tax=Olivibacter TaxID=376469 RepID=A0ABV6HS68_9SPHI|nr:MULTISPECIES: bifunctional histidinol-phosphatase/imidazoleglycerol-phosphate dehydratase HisB [Olivibacter]MCL4640249.1 bifunctional histidinol-phosphatase/imidazoleglycerol-phosphate dehydratase HisB [Olivibacter sp. UJ_SKK_5.1]MDM8173844.1 bifunctional histidinol-phosphatase/imidazoleglycerol-phosphate dehydratase HisB [Olivibacter sp. 47]MDX3915027.1 bifunctional histidinol-phosphatase/imidazoleglycerol-phosphate dehydratase HisB [Pseudosphingobacterium sp.]